MSIEITSPEVQALIRQRMQAGSFLSAEDLLLDMLRSPSPEETRTGADLIAALRACRYPEVDIEPQRVLSPPASKTSAASECSVFRLVSAVEDDPVGGNVEGNTVSHRSRSPLALWGLGELALAGGGEAAEALVVIGGGFEDPVGAVGGG